MVEKVEILKVVITNTVKVVEILKVEITDTVKILSNRVEMVDTKHAKMSNRRKFVN